jgi:hypothetical protein
MSSKRGKKIKLVDETLPKFEETKTNKVMVIGPDEILVVYRCRVCGHCGRTSIKYPSTSDRIFPKATKAAYLNHSMTDLMCDMTTIDMRLEDHTGALV